MLGSPLFPQILTKLFSVHDLRGLRLVLRVSLFTSEVPCLISFSLANRKGSRGDPFDLWNMNLTHNLPIVCP